MVGFPGPPDHLAVLTPSHPIFVPPISDAHLLYPILGGKGPEEPILNAEVAPGDPGNLLGRKRGRGVLS